MELARVFADGLVASCALPTSVLERSRTVRKKLQAIVVFSLVELLIAFGLQQELLLKLIRATTRTISRFLDLLVIHHVPANGVHAEASISIVDTVARRVLLAGGVLPSYALFFALTTLWSIQLISNAMPHIDAQASGNYGVSSRGSCKTTASSPVITISELVYRSIWLALVMSAVLALDLLPVIGRPLSFALCTLAYAATAFDTVWAIRGVPLVERYRIFDSCYVWLMGFGLLATVVSFFGHWLVNAALYAIAYPLLCMAAATPGLQPKPWGPKLPLMHPFKLAILAIVSGPRKVYALWNAGQGRFGKTTKIDRDG